LKHRNAKAIIEWGMTLEIELGQLVVGRWVDNSDVDSSKLYTQPEEVSYAYEELSKISQNSQSLRLLEMFTEFTNL
jgi:fructose-bisphosphate aldolase class II